MSPEPPATPAVRAAREAEHAARHALYDTAVDPAASDADLLDAITKHRDAVAARVRAEEAAKLGSPIVYVAQELHDQWMRGWPVERDGMVLVADLTVSWQRQDDRPRATVAHRLVPALPPEGDHA